MTTVAPVHRWVALLLVLGAATPMLAAPAGADTRGELESARARLTELETRIEAQEERVASVNERLQELAGRLDRRRAEFAATRVELRRTKDALLAEEAQLEALRDRLADRARDVYMRGPGAPIEFVLGARTLAEATRRIGFASRLVAEDAQTAVGIERARAQLDARRDEQQRVLAERASALREVKREHRVLEIAFSDQQSTLASLAADRAEALGLVDRLRDQLRAEEVARATRVAGKGMPITLGEWAGHFLRALGAPVSRDNLVVVVAWETAEYTKATWNPLATTYDMPGATRFNSHGVRNFVSMEQGIDATIRTLSRPGHGYEAIVSNLMASADPMTTGRAINASDWCRGCTNGNYVIGIIPAVEAYYERYANR